MKISKTKQKEIERLKQIQEKQHNMIIKLIDISFEENIEKEIQDMAAVGVIKLMLSMEQLQVRMADLRSVPISEVFGNGSESEADIIMD